MKNFLVYTKSDFPIFLYSLLVYGALVYIAVPVFWLTMLMGIYMAFMAAIFIKRHGASIELNALGVIVSESFKFPFITLRYFSRTFVSFVPVYLCYGIAITTEHYFQPQISGTFLNRSFPWAFIFTACFLTLEAFRLAVAISHLRNSSKVREILISSPIGRQLKNTSMKEEILYAYTTGSVCALSGFLPDLIFYKFTSPTIYRELVLMVTVPFLIGIFRKSFGQKFNLPLQSLLVFRDFHKVGHTNRFWWAAVHGQHHDTIPSGLVGGGGLGDGAFASVISPYFLCSITVTLYKFLVFNANQIADHQYIPGVYPYSEYVLYLKMHHMVHHYNGFVPLSYGATPDLPYIISQDLKDGYRLENPKTQWFLETVRKYENVDEELISSYDKFQVEPYPGYFASRCLGTSNLLRVVFKRKLKGIRFPAVSDSKGNDAIKLVA